MKPEDWQAAASTYDVLTAAKPGSIVQHHGWTMLHGEDGALHLTIFPRSGAPAIDAPGGRTRPGSAVPGLNIT